MADKTNAEIKDGGSAFPQIETIRDDPRLFGDLRSVGGMSLRDYFAAAALTGICIKDSWLPEATAEAAYRRADAMLAEREKGKAK